MRWTFVFAFVLTSLGLAISPVAVNAACTVPNTLTNGQPADANQVMANFTTVAACASAAATPTGTPVSGNLTKFSSPTSITSGDLGGDVTTSGTLTTTLSPTGVSAGAYTCADVTFDAKGRALAAANGSCGGSGGPPTLVQSAGVRGTSNSQTSFSATLSSAPTTGHLLISVMSGYSNGTSMNCPTGFGSVFSYQGIIGNQGVLACARIAASGDGTSYTGTISSANGGTTFAVFEFNGATGFSASGSGGAPTGTTFPLFGTPLNASSYTLGVVENDSANAFSSIAGGTLLFDGTSDGGNSVNHPSVYFNAPSFGPVTITYTGSSYGNSLVAMINIIG